MTITRTRITSPLTAANAAEDSRLGPIPASPTGIAMLPQVVVKVATVVVGLAAIGATVFTLMLPAPWASTALAVCTAIVGLGTVVGIASPGAREAGTTVPAAVQVPQVPPHVGPPL